MTGEAKGGSAAHGKRPLRILLSAYACEPAKGSEPGIGWNWAMALARAGHEVWVLTRANNRAAVERALASKPVENLHFAYYDLPARLRGWKRGGRGVRLYYFLWQWGAYRAARALCRAVSFDLVHHITFGVFRQPSFLAFLGLPFVFGPVGGGESAPRALRKTFPVRGRAIDLLRDAANAAVRFDPLMGAVFSRSSVILCKTRETLHCIPQRHRHKCVVQSELGTTGPGLIDTAAQRRGDGHFDVLFVGRLVYWKGLHLGLRALATLKNVLPAARLTVIGSGPDEAWLRGLADRLGIADSVTWTPWLARAEVLERYAQHDVFLFPSLHDSSGNVVLEALGRGLPVVCVDAGGPALLVDDSCGIKVPAAAPEAVVRRLAHALASLARDSGRRDAMAAAAIRRAARDFSWDAQVTRMEEQYRQLCPAPARDVLGTAAEMGGA